MKYKNLDYCRAFGAHLRKLREKKGFSLRKVASEVDIEFSHLSKIERGIANPTITTVLSIAEALDVPHSELFNFKFAKPNK